MTGMLVLRYAYYFVFFKATKIHSNPFHIYNLEISTLAYLRKKQTNKQNSMTEINIYEPDNQISMHLY